MNVFAKGNALVAKGSTSDAVYVNNCLDEIFKQLSVNRQHIDLFYALYIKLLDRLFGEDVSRSIDLSANPTWVKGVTGGWLRALMAVSAGSNGSSFDILSQRPHSSGRGTNACYIDSLPHPISSILHKFVPQSPMFDLLSKIQGGFEIKVALLPTKLHMFIAEHPVYAAMDAHSQPFVGFALLKTPLNAPNQRSHIAHKSALLLDAVEFFLICMLRYPTTSHTLLAPHSTVPEFMSSSAQNGGRFNPLDTLHNRGPGAWMRGLPYLALLNEYFKLYLPIDGSNRSSTNDSYRNNNNGAAGDSANTPLASNSTGASTRNLVEQTALEAQHAQLFVHLAVAYWVDCALVLRREHGQLGLWRRLLTNVSSGLTDINAAAGMHLGERPHPSPVEVVLVDSASLRWTVASMQCTYLLVVRVLADPQLLERISLLSDRPDLQPFAAAALNRRTPAQSGARSSAGLFGNTNNSLLEGPQSHWQVLQRPLYEMLRTIFNHGESASVDPQVVSLATEVWLLYLQPWAARPICNGNTGILPTRSSNLGVYSSEWKPFIAANLHFYTTLFASYMRLVSQRSLSVSEQEGYHHLFMLERVLQVFTPTLVSVLDELTRAFKSQYLPLKHSHSSRPGLHPQSLHSAQSRGLRPNLSNSSLNSSTNNTNSNSSTVFQTPGFVNNRRAPRTEGYNSAGAEGEDEGEGDVHTDVNNVAPELLRLVKFQHEFLYPDRRIDDLPDCGITDFRKYAAEASINVVATLHQMNENLSAAQDSVSRIVNQAMADLRTLLGLPPYQGPRNRYSERLLNCIAAVVALVPSASAGINTRSNNSNSHNGGAGASGSAGREGSNELGAFRDPYSGRLTEQGRAQILRGQAKCAVQDLLQPRALSVDPLECPLCSYEWSVLASGLIVLSKVLNAALSLPADNAHIMCSWETILRRAWANRPPRDLLHPLRVARSAVRINLRFLASTRLLAVILAMVFYKFVFTF
eukprot:gene10074-11805_t